jgi:hypothetical protein
MASETADAAPTETVGDSSGAENKARALRQQSTIQFPYGDLDSAIEVATALFEKAAGGPASQDQLVADLGHIEPSGTFRQKVSTAKIFGLVESAGIGAVKLTDLGFRIVDRSQERHAKAEAFLKVDLYRKLFEDFKGRMLPPRPAPLERTFESYGVASKQKDKARQAFERSAQQAGFFEQGRDRLIMPSGAGTHVATEKPERPSLISGGGGGGNGGDDGQPKLDPLIMGLLKRMPIPKKGGWPVQDRARWLQTLAMNLSFIYEDDAEDESIDVTLRGRKETRQ